MPILKESDLVALNSNSYSKQKMPCNGRGRLGARKGLLRSALQSESWKEETKNSRSLVDPHQRMLLVQPILNESHPLVLLAEIEKNPKQPPISRSHHQKASKQAWKPFLQFQQLNDGLGEYRARAYGKSGHAEKYARLVTTSESEVETFKGERNPQTHHCEGDYSVLCIQKIKLPFGDIFERKGSWPIPGLRSNREKRLKHWAVRKRQSFIHVPLIQYVNEQI